MKHRLLTTIAAVLLVRCGTTKQSVLNIAQGWRFSTGEELKAEGK